MSHRYRLSVLQCCVMTVLAVVYLLTHAADPEHRVARVGFLSQFESASDPTFATFAKRVHELGYIEGENLFLEAHFADGHIERLPILAGELVEHKMDVIVVGGTPGAMAAKNATSTIPIVFAG